MRGVALLVLLVGGCAGMPAVLEEEPNPVDVAINHTVLLKSPGCTGVRIGGGLVLTAAHCTGSKVLGEAYGDFTLKYQSEVHDFSILAGDAPIDAVWLRDARVGEHLYAVGYPTSIDGTGQHLTVTDGVYTGVEYMLMQRTTAYAYYGNSGGGAWGDDGALLGVLVEIRPATEGNYGVIPMPAHSYMVPIKWVRSLVLTD